jgi:hypothetical protein
LWSKSFQNVSGTDVGKISANGANFHIKAQFIPGFTNVFADLISRGNFQKFKTLAPLADIFPTSVPETVE